MKKAVCFMLAVVLLLSLAACGHTHVFGEWVVITEPSCTNGGLKERTCECGEKETENIAAVGHTYGETTELSAVTCTEDGQTEKTCTVCGETVAETVSAAGHSFTAATAFAPKTCTNCGYTEGKALAEVIAVGDVIEAEDHSFTIEETKFTGELKEKRGSTTYIYGGDGHTLAIKLSFTNLSAEAFERWNSDRVSDVSLEYKGKYQYEGEYWCPDDDIVPLATESLYIVYTVPEAMSQDTTGAILATFTIDGTTYAMVVQEGDGTDAGVEEGAASAASDVAADISVGDIRTDGEKFSFEFQDLYYTSKPSEKTGNVTYSFGTDGSYYLVCKFSFTNLSSEALESWGTERISDMKLIFADKYEYEGTVWCPGDDIVPLAAGSMYILFEVPETVETSADPLTITFKIDGNEFKVDGRANG